MALTQIQGEMVSSITFPSGTTAQRPSSLANGYTRWNTTLGQLETWAGASWVALATQAYSASVLIVAGGGGGGTRNAQNVGGGNGGSGIVIIRYLGTAQRASGGTVTVTGGYVIHTFTASGTFIA